MTQPTFRDVELISAYLDGQLSQADGARLETRIKAEPQVRTIYEELNQVRGVLRKLPARRARRNFTLTTKMAGIRAPLPRSFPILRFASVMATVLFFFAFAANLWVPAVAVLRASVPAPVLGMGGGGGGNDNQSAVESAPAAAQAPELPAAAPAPGVEVTPTAELRMAAPTQSAEIAPYGAATPEAATQAKINPNSEDQARALAPQELIQPPVSPFILTGLLFLAVISGGTGYLMRFRVENSWFKAHALLPTKITGRQMLGILIGIVVLAALILTIFWLANTPFYVPAAVNFPAGAGDRGAVGGGDKSGVVGPQNQTFRLAPGLGYDFSVMDAAGMVTAVDFPADVFKSEMAVTYSAGLVVPTAGIDVPTFTSFSLMAVEPSMQPQLPFTVSLDYDPNALAGVDESGLILLWWSGSEWKDAATTCNPVGFYERMLDVHRLRISICQMGNFALAAP